MATTKQTTLTTALRARLLKQVENRTGNWETAAKRLLGK